VKKLRIRKIAGRMFRPFTQKELAVVRKLYTKQGADKIGLLLKRSSRCVYHAAKALGLKKDRNWERFTEDEIKLLQSSYEQQGAERLAIRMGHSSRAVRMRASRLGLHRTSLVCAKFHPVTMPQTELAYLAGLIDGEGTVTFKARYKKPNPTPLFAITNTSLEMIEWIQERIPTPNTPVTEKPGLGRGFSKGSLLGHWTIQVRGMNYLPLYKALLPFLTVKRPQMEMLVEWVTLRLGQLRGSSEITERGQLLQRMIRFMNLRGYGISPEEKLKMYRSSTWEPALALMKRLGM
jgi:hypothetical protein